MRKLAAGQRGSAVVYAVLTLAVALAATALVKGCEDDPVAPELQAAPQAAAPPPLPLPMPEPVAEAAPEPAPVVAVQPNVPTLQVHNPCSQPLLIAFNFENASGTRVTEGFVQIAAGARTTPQTRSGPLPLYSRTLHYYTETLASEPVEVGRRAEVVGDRRVEMKQIDLDPPATAIELECPGATSGRP